MGSVLAFPIAAAMAILRRKKWEDAMLPVTAAMIGILLLSGMVTTFLPGVFFCILAAIAATGFCIRTGLRDRDALTAAVMTPGVFAFLLLFLFFLICSLGGVIEGKADTWAHWALAVKNYRYYDDLVIGSPSTDRFATYPPALPLWNYLSTRLWFHYSEGTALMGQDMLYVILLLPLYRLLPGGRHPRRFLILLFATLALPFLARADGYTSLYADSVLALAAGNCMIQVLRYLRDKDPFDLWGFTAGLFLLALTKETGIAIGGLIIFFVTVYVMICRKRIGVAPEGSRIAMLAVPWAGFLLGPALWYGFLYLAPGGAKAGSSSAAKEAAAMIAARNVSKSGTMDHVTRFLDPDRWLHRFESWQYAAFRREYLTGIFTTQYYGISVFFLITPFVFMILVLLMPWIRDRFVGGWQEVSADPEAGRRYRIGSELYYVLFAVTALFDLAVMPLMYLVLFPWGEVRYLASFPRYLTPLTVMVLYYTIFLFLEESREREVSFGGAKRIRTVAPYLILLLFLLQSGAAQMILSLAIDPPERTMFWGLEHSDVIPQPGEYFLFVNDTAEEEDGEKDSTSRFYYRVMPARSNRSDFAMQVKDGTDERTGKSIVHEMTPEEFEERLRSDAVDYLYLHHVDSAFAGRYGSFFAPDTPIGDSKLYRVDLSGERPILTLLGE